MSARLPFTISTQSLTFYVKGKPYSLTRDHDHFPAAKNLLQQPGAHPVQQLVDMVDQRQALLRDSHGALQIIGADLVFRGTVLRGLWVDKIKQFRAAGEPFTALFNALGSLVQNPTQAAIDRLPVFLEKSNLGFLEDGRFIAYKAVKEDYFDIHTGKTFRNMIGDTPFMPRDQVNSDPNACCSTGLHVGTPDYVKDFGLGHAGRRVMLIAVWPHDVVSVPYSYDGTKMRICAYEVIDELDEVYAGTILGRPVITPRTQLPPVGDAPEAPAAAAAEPELTPYQQVKVGDVVSYTDAEAPFIGVVIDIDADADERVCVRGTDTGAVWLDEDNFIEIIQASEVTASMLVFEGCTVTIEGHPSLRDGEYLVAGLVENGDGAQDVPSDEVFTVELGDANETCVPVQNQHIVVVEATELGVLWPRTEVTTEADGSTTLTSLDGHDLRGEAEFQSDLEDDYDQDHEDEVGDQGADVGESGDWYDPANEPARAEVGDLVEVLPGGWPPAGIYPVIEVFASGVIVQTEHDGKVAVNDAYIEAIDRRPWMRAEIGGTVQLAEVVQGNLNNWPVGGLYEVVDLRVNANPPTLQIRSPAGPWWVAAERVAAAYPKA